MNSKTSKSRPFASDREKAEGTGGQQGSVLKGERAPQRGTERLTEKDLRALKDKKPSD